MPHSEPLPRSKHTPVTMFSEARDRRLIKLVKENPVLYDHFDVKYMDFNAREVAWQKIGDELKRPAQECKVRWIHIRDVNRRILRKSINSPNLKKKIYKYEKDMAFMRPFYREIVFQKSAAAAFESDEHDDNNEDVNVVVVEKDEEDSDESEEPVEKPKNKRAKPTKRKATKKKRPIVQEEPEDSASFDNNVTQELDPKDPVDAFLLGIGATLKMFNPYHLNLAKSKIFSVVQEHELQQIVRQPQREQLDDGDVKLSSCGQNLFLH